MKKEKLFLLTVHYDEIKLLLFLCRFQNRVLDFLKVK